MRLAFFMHDLSGGGVERMRLALCRELQRRGHDVTLILQRRGGNLENVVGSSLNCVSLECSRTSRSAFSLARTLSSLQPDILVSSLDHNNIAAIIGNRLRPHRCPLLICQHNSLLQQRAVGWKYMLVPSLYRGLQIWADGLIAVSNGVAQEILDGRIFRKSAVHVIYNPVIGTGPQQHSGAPPSDVLLSGPPIFLFVGRLVNQKDPFLFLDALALCIRKAPARGAILGEGPLLPELQAKARELGIEGSITFAGFVEDVAPFLRHAECLVMTSRYEGFGNVLVEALSCGTPVVASDCCHGPAEILENGKWGVLISSRSPHDFAEAMTSNLRDRWSADQLRSRACDFSVEKCADQHEELFNRLVVRRRNSIFGLQFETRPLREIAALTLSAPRSSMGNLVVTTNINHVRLLRRPEFRAACRGASVILADGAPVALFLRLRGHRGIRRQTGCDLLRAIMAHSEFLTSRPFFVLESHATESRLRTALVHWGWSEVGMAVAPESLLQSRAACETLSEKIRNHNAKLVILTLGAPTSEVFAWRFGSSLGPCWVICVGQALRVELGMATRPPPYLARAGLEWAWRLAREPRRLWRRYVLDAVWFPIAIVLDLLGSSTYPRH